MSGSSEEIKEQRQNRATKEATPWALGIQSFSGNGANAAKVANFPFDLFKTLQTRLVLPLTLTLRQVPPNVALSQSTSPRSGPGVAGPKDAVGATWTGVHGLQQEAGEGRWAGGPPRRDPLQSPPVALCFQGEAAFDTQQAAHCLWYAVWSLDLMSSAETLRCS